MRRIPLRRFKTSLFFRLTLSALLLSVPILSVAATRYGDIANQMALVARERPGVAFVRRGAALLQSVADVSLRAQPTRAAPAKVLLADQDRSRVEIALERFAGEAAALRDLGAGPALTAPARAAWRRAQATPGAARLAALGAAVLKAQGFIVDASRLSFESEIVEGNLGDALSTQNGILMQRLSVASVTAELAAQRHRASVDDRIALATYIGSADAAAVALGVDRAGAAEDGASLDVGLAAGWNALDGAAAALRRPLEAMVRGRPPVPGTADALRVRRHLLVSASRRFGVLLERQLALAFDRRASAASRRQQYVGLIALLSVVLGGGIVALVGWVVVRRDRNELLRAQQQSRTLGAELAQRHAERALLLTQAQFSAIFERSNMGIALLAANGETIEANARLKEMLHGADVIPPRDAAFAELVHGATATYHCERLLERSGTRQWLEMTVSLVSAPAPAPVTAIAMLRDITERKTLDARMRYATMHDELTSLANRSQFIESLERELASDTVRSNPFAVLFIDLDDFKLVNDTLGHHAGDQVLLVTARRIQAASRDVGLVARFHGDEFAVLLREVGAEGAAEAAAERIRCELIAPMSIEGRLVVVSSSIGVVPGDGGFASAEDMLRRADAAMYRTKSLGRSNEFVARRPGRLTSVSSIAS